jgi:hypothetical protein
VTFVVLVLLLEPPEEELLVPFTKTVPLMMAFDEELLEVVDVVFLGTVEFVVEELPFVPVVFN